MQDVTRNSYSLYKRETGSRTIWYVRFWNDDTQTYSSGRSTGQTTKPAAHRQVQKWLTSGLPEVQKKDLRVTKNRLMGAISKYLEDCELIKRGEKFDTGELIKLFYTQATNQQMSSRETFVEYLYRFWDWNGDYVQGRLERGKTIGKKYVGDCNSKIKHHIEPYFKDTLLLDVTTNILEQYMRSIPRRDEDPKNGYSRRTINIIMKLIKKALKEAIRLEIIPRNPADKIELLADDRRERGILSPTELDSLFKHEWPDERSKTASILATVSGMRISEIIGLRIGELDMENNVIHVRHSFSAYEKRIKGTKNEKPRFIYTDASILSMLSDLHHKNPWKNSYIFWGIDPDKPMNYKTIEAHLEKVLAAIMGEFLKTSVNDEWRSLASDLASKIEFTAHEMIAIGIDNLDTTQDALRIRYCYSCLGKKVKALNYEDEKIIPVKTSIFKRLSTLCGKNGIKLIVRGVDHENPLDFGNLSTEEEKKIKMVMGEIVRLERNITFHSFRHFFNSTIRGTVSDDILRLQTGHSDEKMTDLYDHMTDDRGD